MSDREKLDEALRWLNLFDLLRKKVSSYAINDQTFNNGLAAEIQKLRDEINNQLVELPKEIDIEDYDLDPHFHA